MPKLINKGTHKAQRSRGIISNFLEEDHLDKNVLIMMLGLAPKIQDFYVYKCYNVISFGPKSGRT